MGLWQDERGATAIEYGLIAGLIAAVVIASMGAIGSNLNVLYALVEAMQP